MSGRMFRVLLVEVDDKDKQQRMKLKGLAGEELEDVARIMPFGFHSVPPKDSHGMVLQFGGGPDGGRLLNAVLGLEHPEHRLKDRELGSTAIYDKDGNVISLVEKEMRIKHAKKKVIQVGDNISLTIDENGVDWKTPSGMKISHNGQNIGNGHKHRNVQPGAGLTGDPDV